MKSSKPSQESIEWAERILDAEGLPDAETLRDFGSCVESIAEALDIALEKGGTYMKGFDDGVEEGRRIERNLRVLFNKGKS